MKIVISVTKSDVDLSFNGSDETRTTNFVWLLAASRINQPTVVVAVCLPLLWTEQLGCDLGSELIRSGGYLCLLE
jgi:hypothetical protein